MKIWFLKKLFTIMSKWLHSGLLAWIKEQTLTKIILTVNFMITPICTATFVQEQLSERELNSLMFYKFCMSEISTWKLCSPPPFFRQLAMMLLQSCIIAKFGIYLKMWRKASRTAHKDVPKPFQEQCKDLSTMLLGQLMYSAVEMVQGALIALYSLSVVLLKLGNQETNKVFLITMVASKSITFALLPMIQIFASPPIRDDLKQCLIRFTGTVLSHLIYSTRHLVKPRNKNSCPENYFDEYTLCPVQGKLAVLGEVQSVSKHETPVIQSILTPGI